MTARTFAYFLAQNFHSEFIQQSRLCQLFCSSHSRQQTLSRILVLSLLYLVVCVTGLFTQEKEKFIRSSISSPTRRERAVPTEATHVVTAIFPPSHHISLISITISMNISLVRWTLFTGLFVTCCFVANNPLYCRLPTSVTPNVNNPVHMPSGVGNVYGLMLRSRTYTETKKKKKNKLLSAITF